MAKLLHIFYHKEGTFSLLCQQVLFLTVSQMQATHQALPQRKSPFKFLMTINDNKIPYQKSPQTLTGWAIFL